MVWGFLQERKAYLRELHAESQRVLRGSISEYLSSLCYFYDVKVVPYCSRLIKFCSALSYWLESRNASFKPIPMVQKPISSVLEKIRKRKLEISKM